MKMSRAAAGGEIGMTYEVHYTLQIWDSWQDRSVATRVASEHVYKTVADAQCRCHQLARHIDNSDIYIVAINPGEAE